MDTSMNPYKNNLLFLNFNQDSTCFASGTTEGFCIFNSDRLRVSEKQKFANSGIRYVEMLFRCNCLALVGDGSNDDFPSNRIMIWDDYKKAVCLKLDFESEVRGVRLRRDRIIAILQNEIRVFSMKDSPQLLSTFRTADNRKGLCALCSSSTNSVLAYPSVKCGAIDVADLTTGRRVSIEAHQTAIACLAMDVQGTRLATASEKGTLIRIFDLKSGRLVGERRRGAQQATIYSIAFNQNSSRLCVSSDHGTVHIFSLDDPSLNRVSSLSNVNFLPKYFSSIWSFSKFTVPNNVPCICAFGSDNSSIIVLCSNGFYYKFLCNSKGECNIDVSFLFLELTEFD